MALDFNGTTQYAVDNSNMLDFSVGDWTLMAWWNFDSVASPGLYSRWDTTGSPSMVVYAGGAGKITFFTSTGNFVETGVILTTSTWYHIAIVWTDAGATNNDKAKLYLNGVLQTWTTASGTLNAGNNGVNFAYGVLQGGTNFTDGRVEGFKAWQAALDEGWIKKECASYHPVRTQDLYLWHPLDVYTGTTPLDKSGNGRDFTTNGSPTQAQGPTAFSYGSSAIGRHNSFRTELNRRNAFRRLKTSTLIPLHQQGL